MVLIQRKAITPGVIGATFLLSAALASLFAAGIAIFAPAIEREFAFPELAEVLLVLAAMLPITSITTVTGSLLQRALQFRTLALIGLASQVVYIVSAIGFAVAGMGLWSLVWAQMLQWAVEAVLELFAVRKQYRLALSFPAIREVLHTGGMFTASKMAKWAANSADRVIIGRLLGAAELGLYSRAATLMRTARQLAGAGPMRVLFSSFSKMQHDPPRMCRAYNRSLSLSLVASALVSGFFFVNADLIVRVMLGPRWLETVPIVQVLFLGFIPKSAALVAETIPLAFGLGRTSTIREIAQLILVVVGGAIGAQFGIVGAAAGVCAGYWLFYFICLILVQQLLHPRLAETLRIHLNSLLIAAPPVLFSLAAAFLLPSHGLLMKCIPAAVFCAVAAAALAFGPANLVGDDIARARSHLWARFARWLPPFIRPDAKGA
jgi:PST family polysaccharide transporter